MLTLYDFELAPNPRRARVFLAEKNIDYKKWIRHKLGS